jgi:O-antigen ligase
MAFTDLLRRLLLPSLLVLLSACWLLGGVTTDASAADEWLQLLALPVLLVAIGILLEQGPVGSLQRWALLVAGLVVLVPLLQLLPLPGAVWDVAPARAGLRADLAAAGVQAPSLHGSLSPAATEQSLWSLLPALALFIGALLLTPRQRVILVKAMLAVIAFNVLFAFFQAGLPNDSTLRLYSGGGIGFGGLLANTNHQATALIIGMLLAVGQAAHARHRGQAGRGHPHAWLLYAGFAAACLLLLPLTSSRAGMVIALPALAVVLVLTGAVTVRDIVRSRRTWLSLALVLAIAVIGIRAGLGWMQVDQAEELRHVLAATSWRIGNQQAPWGSGMGSFVTVFAQSAPSSLWLDVYVNHAHNEYAQWWLEAGIPGMLALAASLGVLGVAGWRILQARGRDGDAILAAACFVAICAVLAHSAADFPLRTLTLMGTSAALAGLMLGALADRSREVRPLHPRIEADTDTAQPA